MHNESDTGSIVIGSDGEIDIGGDVEGVDDIGTEGVNASDDESGNGSFSDG